MILPGSSTVGQSTLRVVFIRGFWCVKNPHDGFRLVATNFMKIASPYFLGGAKKDDSQFDNSWLPMFQMGWLAQPNLPNEPEASRCPDIYILELRKRSGADTCSPQQKRKNCLLLLTRGGVTRVDVWIVVCIYIYIYTHTTSIYIVVQGEVQGTD